MKGVLLAFVPASSRHGWDQCAPTAGLVPADLALYQVKLVGFVLLPCERMVWKTAASANRLDILATTRFGRRDCHRVKERLFSNGLPESRKLILRLSAAIAYGTRIHKTDYKHSLLSFDHQSCPYTV
jgi:hypothetical protein